MSSNTPCISPQEVNIQAFPVDSYPRLKAACGKLHRKALILSLPKGKSFLSSNFLDSLLPGGSALC